VFDPPSILFDVSVVSALFDTTFDVIIRGAGVANVPPRMPLVATVLACSISDIVAFACPVSNPTTVATFAVSVLIVATFAVVGATKVVLALNVTTAPTVVAAFITSDCPIKCVTFEVMVVFDPPRILFDVSVVSALFDTTFDVMIRGADT